MKIEKKLKTTSRAKLLNVDKEIEKTMESFYVAHNTLLPYMFKNLSSDKQRLIFFAEMSVSNAVERVFKYLRAFRPSVYFKDVKIEEGPYLKNSKKITFKHNIDMNLLSEFINYNLKFITKKLSSADFYFNPLNEENESGSSFFIKNCFRIHDLEKPFQRTSTTPGACIFFRVFEDKKLLSVLNEEKLNFYTARIKYIQSDNSILFSYIFEVDNKTLSKEKIEKIKKIFNKSLEKALVKELNLANEMLIGEQKIADFIIRNQNKRMKKSVMLMCFLTDLNLILKTDIIKNIQKSVLCLRIKYSQIILLYCRTKKRFKE